MMFRGLLGTVGSGKMERAGDIRSLGEALRSTGDLNPFNQQDENGKASLSPTIASFQSRNGLKTDGVMKPGGPTELTLKSETARNAGTALGGRAPNLVKISAGVGPGQPNKPEDVDTLSTMLGATDFLKEAAKSLDKVQRGPKPADPAAGTSPLSPQTPSLWDPAPQDQAPQSQAPQSQAPQGEQAENRGVSVLSTALKQFQNAFNLKQDGVALPDGETMTQISTLFSPILDAALKDPTSVGGLPKPTPPQPYFGPYGIVYPEGTTFDGDGNTVLAPVEDTATVLMEGTSGMVEVPYDEYRRLHTDRFIHWKQLPWGLDLTLPSQAQRARFTIDPEDPTNPVFPTEIAHRVAYGPNAPEWVPPEAQQTTAESMATDRLTASVGEDTLTGGTKADALGDVLGDTLHSGDDGTLGTVRNPAPDAEAVRHAQQSAASDYGAGLGSSGPVTALDAGEEAQRQADRNALLAEHSAYTAFEANRDAYDGAAAGGQVSFARNGDRVTVDFGDGTVMDLPEAKAAEVARVLQEVPEAVGTLKGFQDGSLSRADNRGDLAELFEIVDAYEASGPDQRGRHTPARQVARTSVNARIAALGYDDIDALQTALQQKAMVEEAFEAQASGQDPRVVSDMLLLGLRGEAGFGLGDAVELALAMAPVTGTAMAVAASIDAAARMRTAAEAQDWDAFQGAAGALGIEAMGFIPFFGPAAKKGAKAARGGKPGGKPGGSFIQRGVENAKTRYKSAKAEWKKRHAQAELNVMRTQGQATESMSRAAIREAYPKNDAEKVFGRQISEDVWNKIKATHGPSIQATLTNFVSDAQEAHLARLLSEAGGTVRGTDPKDVQYFRKGYPKTRRFDVVTEEEFLEEDGFLVPQETGRTDAKGNPILGTGFEVKYDGAHWTQEDFDKGVKPSAPATATKANAGMKEVTQTALMRQPMHQIPHERLRPAMERILRKPQYNLAEDEIDTLLKGLDDFHAKERKARNGVPFGVFVRLYWDTFRKLLETPPAP